MSGDSLEVRRVRHELKRRKLRVRAAPSHAPTVPVQEPVFDNEDTIPMAQDGPESGPPAAADSVSAS